MPNAAPGDFPATVDYRSDGDRDSGHAFWVPDDEQWAMFVSNSLPMVLQWENNPDIDHRVPYENMHSKFTFGFDMGRRGNGYIAILHRRMRVDVISFLSFAIVLIDASHNACLERCRQT